MLILSWTLLGCQTVTLPLVCTVRIGYGPRKVGCNLEHWPWGHSEQELVHQLTSLLALRSLLSIWPCCICCRVRRLATKGRSKYISLWIKATAPGETLFNELWEIDRAACIAWARACSTNCFASVGMLGGFACTKVWRTWPTVWWACSQMPLDCCPTVVDRENVGFAVARKCGFRWIVKQKLAEWILQIWSWGLCCNRCCLLLNYNSFFPFHILIFSLFVRSEINLFSARPSLAACHSHS